MSAPSDIPGPPGRSASVILVAQREITSRLRSKAFLVSTGIMLAVLLGSVIIGGIVSSQRDDTAVAVVGSAAQQLQNVGGVELHRVDTEDQAIALVRDETVEAAVLPADGPTGLKVVAAESEPTTLVAQLSVAPPVELLDPPVRGSGLRYLAAVAFGAVFMISAATFGGVIAQSVVEEKQTRIVEILLSTIAAPVLLTGKIIGNTLLAFAQVILIVGCSVLGLSMTGGGALLGILGAPIAWFVIFFMIGFVLLASMYAASASLVSRQEDIQSTVTPVSMLVMIPYFLVIFLNDNDLVVTIMSYVPFSAAVGMPLRIFLGTAAWWEPLLSLAILIATTAGVIGVASRIYRNALLRTGARVKLADALRQSPDA